MKKIDSIHKTIIGFRSLSNKIVVDVGCGTGDFVRCLAKEGADVTGVDLPDMLEKPKKEQ